MVVQHIVTRLIMDLCPAAERKPGLRLIRRWWEHPTLEIMGIKSGHATAEGGRRQGRNIPRERKSRLE